ncbi:MAG: hypothetical protein NXI31_26750 [bacterium]|nr:hypothetical protein [bacterium]
MDLPTTLSRQFRVPRFVARAAIAATVAWFVRCSRPADVAELRARRPELFERVEAGRIPRFAAFGWLVTCCTRLATSSRAIRESILAVGLRDGDVVPFLAAFVRLLEREVGRELTAGLVRRVPGLARLTVWPGAPLQAADSEH